MHLAASAPAALVRMKPSTFDAISSVLVEKFHVEAAAVAAAGRRSTSSASIRWR